jgi:hypothetical protein
MDVLILLALIGLGWIGIVGVMEIKSFSRRLEDWNPLEKWSPRVTVEIPELNSLSKKLEEWNPQVTVEFPEHLDYEKCYYCGERFPPDQTVKVDKYTYCQKHAVRR